MCGLNKMYIKSDDNKWLEEGAERCKQQQEVNLNGSKQSSGIKEMQIP